MNKYDKMIDINKRKSKEKVIIAKMAIKEIQKNEEQLSVSKLTEMTGLSRGFFYKNPEVRKIIDDVQAQQIVRKSPKRKILDLAMNSRIEFLQKQIESLQQENDMLKNENEKLTKILKKRNLSIIKEL